MGQAKNRGSREERLAESLGMKQRSLTEIKKEYGLPENSEFLGYGVHNVERDEFLAQFEDTPAATKRAWAKDPQLALQFDEFAAAYEVSRKCKEAIVVGMFDIGDQIYVAGITDNQ